MALCFSAVVTNKIAGSVTSNTATLYREVGHQFTRFVRLL